MYITNTTNTATVVHSIASTTNGIAPNNIALVALRKPFAPFLCSLLSVGESAYPKQRIFGTRKGH